MSEIPMRKLLIKLKDPQNRSQLKHLKDAMQNALEEDGLKDRFTIWSYMDVLDNARNVSNCLLLHSFLSFRLRQLFS